jgi:hypothetical protein
MATKINKFNKNYPPTLKKALGIEEPKSFQSPKIDLLATPDNPFKNLVDSTKQSVAPPKPVKSPALPNNTIFNDAETGKLTGIKTPGGQTLLNLSPSEVRALAAKYAGQTQTPAGFQTAEQGTAQVQKNEQGVRNQELLQMAQNGLLTPQELQSIQGASLDVGQTLGAGALGVIPGLAGGVATGLVAGALGGAATGAAAGGFVTPLAVGLTAAGALAGFLVAARSSIKSEQSEEFAADQLSLTKGERALRSLITDTNQNPQNAPENIALFYQTLNNIDVAHVKTWKDSQEDLNRFLGNDGNLQLAKFEIFNSVMRTYYVNRFETALAQPNSSAILITNEELEAYNEETN